MSEKNKLFDPCEQCQHRGPDGLCLSCKHTEAQADASAQRVRHTNTIKALILMVDQWCEERVDHEFFIDCDIDTEAISANATAVLELERLGLVEIKEYVGRRVIADWVKPVDELLKGGPKLANYGGSVGND